MAAEGSTPSPSATGAAARGQTVVTRHVTLAGLDPDLENRIKAACWRLATEGHDIRLRAWSGVQCDLLVLGPAEHHGRLLDSALARGVPTLRFVDDSAGAADPRDDALSTIASVEQIAKAVRTALQPKEATQEPVARQANDKVSGLVWLMVERRPAYGAVHAISDSYEVWLVPGERRLCARTHSDLIGARERLLSPKWVFHRVRGSRVPDGPHQSLEEFFLDACLRASHRLPRFPRGDFRLIEPVDAGTLLHAAEIRVLAAEFGARETISTDDVGAIADVGQHHANAFLWATYASGALVSCRASSARAGSLLDRLRDAFARVAR